MTFGTLGPAAWAVAAASLGGAAALAWVEWRRPDRRWRGWRAAAGAVAAVALGMLGLRPAWPGDPDGTTAALWTPGAGGVANPDATAAARASRFALPGAGKVQGAREVPDVGYLRRHFPGIGTLDILGDGLEPSELDVLRGLRVRLHPGTEAGGAAFRSVDWPRELPRGEALTVRGRANGGAALAGGKVTLEGPDGTVTEAALLPAADDAREATFTVSAPGLPAPGRFGWKLRLIAGEAGGGRTLAEERLGVAAVASRPPRVLFLESAPSFETSTLRRFLGERGAHVAARTRVGQERERFAGDEFGVVDAALLGNFDVLVTDGRALADLSAPERGALRDAVTTGGLGVLALEDEAALAPDRGGLADAGWFLPGRLAPVGGEGADRTVRPRWPGLVGRTAETALPAAPFELFPEGAGERALLRDGQGRALAVAAGRGRGQTAWTLLRETWRWWRGEEPGWFAAHWAFLLGELARREEPAGRWVVEDAGPVFVNAPVTLRRSGAADPPAPGFVTAENGGESARVPLLRDTAEPTRWRTTFWPRETGWHRVQTPPDGPAWDFFVNGAGEWPGVQAARRQAATARWVTTRGWTEPGATPAPPVPAPAGGWWFAVFLLGAGFLWAERRFGGGPGLR